MSNTPTRDVTGNSRISATTGMLLLVMLVVEGVTVLDVRGMITLHVFLGIMLVGPVVLKIASTLYRFLRYYTSDADYVRKGPPHVVLRILGPLVILSSLALLGTGIALLWQSHNDLLLTAHQGSFIVWFAVMTVHVLGHLREALVETARELRRLSPRQSLRLAAVAVSLIAGVGLATALLPSAAPWTHRPPETHAHHRHD